MIIYNVAQITAEVTRVSKNTAKRICSEGAVTDGSIGSPEKHYGTSRRVVTDNFDRAAIKRTVHEFYTCKEYPTVPEALDLCWRKDKSCDNRKYVMESRCMLKGMTIQNAVERIN